MTAGKKKHLDDLAAQAHEAEADKGRHKMEAAVLATLAARGDDAQDIRAGCETLRWSRADHDAIWQALWTCYLEGIPVQADMVKARLPKGADVQDAAYLAAILDGSKAEDVKVAAEYVKTLADQDRIRQAEAAVRDLEAAVGQAKADQEAGDTEAAFGRLTAAMLDIGRARGLVVEPASEAEAVPAFMAELKQRRDDPRAYTGLDCGTTHLNEVLNGLGTGLYIFSGAPSTGKTTLAKQIADHVALSEKVPVLFFSFEQSAEELRTKSLARMTSTDSRAIWKGRVGDAAAWGKVEKAGDDYARGAGRCLKIIESGRDDTVERIRGRALIARRREEIRRDEAGKAESKPPCLVIIDYLQIIPTPDTIRLDGIKDKVDFNLSELRRMARDLKAPVLVISSLNREGYRTDRNAKKPTKPTLASLKESGGIEYSADVVVCLWRDAKESETLTKNFERKTNRIEALVLKNRNGELATVKLDFTPAWALFTDGEKPEALTVEDAQG